MLKKQSETRFGHGSGQAFDPELETGKTPRMKKKRLYSPFKRNQMRWALVIYKWKEGISWNNYHLDILQVLGKDNLSDLPLTNKDAKRFVVDGLRTTEEKLEIFERFIRVVLPDYLTDGNEEEHVLSTAKSLAEFSSLDSLLKENEYQAAHLKMEELADKSMFVSFKTNDLNKLRIEDLDFETKNLGCIQTEPLRIINSVDFCNLKKISDSKFYFVQMFKLKIPDELFFIPLDYKYFKHEELIKISAEFSEYYKMFLDGVAQFSQGNKLVRYDYRKGLATPCPNGYEFYLFLKDQEKEPCVGSINIYDFAHEIESRLIRRGVKRERDLAKNHPEWFKKRKSFIDKNNPNFDQEYRNYGPYGPQGEYLPDYMIADVKRLTSTAYDKDDSVYFLTEHAMFAKINALRMELDLL